MRYNEPVFLPGESARADLRIGKMGAREPAPNLQPGRYAAIDVGTNSVLLLIADIEPGGGFRSRTERQKITRLGEKVSASKVLSNAAMMRTLAVVVEYVTEARRARTDCTAIVGTAVLRDARNSDEFCELVRARSGLPIEVITGEQEAELAWRAQAGDSALNASGRPRAVLDIGGGSTELVRGFGEEIFSRASFPIGAVRLTEQCLKQDPPAVQEVDLAEQCVERVLSPLEPVEPDARLIGTGGTITNLGAVARAAGMATCPETHGARLSHATVAELVDLFRSLPIRFRQRVPGLEPQRADVILGGAMILHQAMARLSTPEILVSTHGIRHGCVLMMAEKAHSLLG